MKNIADGIPSYKSLYNKSEIIKAIADPLRLEILYLLKNEELCACHIDSTLDKPQSTVAHHLSLLKKANLLNWRKEGKWTYYSLSNPKIIDLIEEITSENTIDEGIASERVDSGEIAIEQVINNENTKTRIPNQADNEFFKAFEDKAKEFNIFKVGYTKIETKKFNPEIKHENLIVLATPMDENIIKAPLGEKAKKLNKAFYANFRKITEELSQYLKKRGFKTQIAYPNEILLDLPYFAQKTGMGYVGNSGLLITPEQGSKIKLSGILTSIDNSIFDKSPKSINKHKWIRDYCKDCGECIENCESEALIKSEGDIAKLSESRCIGSEEGCTYCIEKCPFNEKGYSLVKEELSENFEDKILKIIDTLS